MTVTVSTFTDEKALQFLDDEEGDDANEDAQTDRHVVTVTLSAATVGMSVRLMRVTVASVAMAMSVSLLSRGSTDRTEHNSICSETYKPMRYPQRGH